MAGEASILNHIKNVTTQPDFLLCTQITPFADTAHGAGTEKSR
jgi:hypothetical protein